jgi:hypothetical protein
LVRETRLLKSEFVLDYCNHGEDVSFYANGQDLVLPLEMWDDMGRPDRVTVTVVPGDELNA